MPDPAHIYLHTDRFYPRGEWRLIPALLVRLVAPTVGSVLFSTSDGALRLERIHHLNDPVTAEYWVYTREFDCIAAAIEEDYARRRLWHKAFHDVQRIRKDICRPAGINPASLGKAGPA